MQNKCNSWYKIPFQGTSLFKNENEIQTFFRQPKTYGVLPIDLTEEISEEKWMCEERLSKETGRLADKFKSTVIV